jgi:predicted N-formylglutamate amidohydrolase
MTMQDVVVVSCEHGGNRIPAAYRHLFTGCGALLRSHRGVDIGALRLARDMAQALSAPLYACTVSRLLIEVNRSPHHRQLYAAQVRAAPLHVRRELLDQYYLPYRNRVQACIADAISRGARVVHVSCHSFTPELDGAVRNADIGLLYDPRRPGERTLRGHWRAACKRAAPGLKVRMNYPYAGTADGFTTYLRRQFAAERYIGIELELNQRHALDSAAHWRVVRAAVIEALQQALGLFNSGSDQGR